MNSPRLLKIEMPATCFSNAFDKHEKGIKDIVEKTNKWAVYARKLPERAYKVCG
jgi:hypothetical protein